MYGSQPDGLGVRSSNFATERRFRNAANSDIERENPAGLGVLRETVGVHVDPTSIDELCRGGGHEQRLHVLAAEGAAGYVLDRHFDLTINPAVRRIAGDTPATPMGRPEITLGIDSGAIGDAG